MSQIRKPAPGDSTWELWKIVAELVDAVNAWNNATISPQSAGQVKVAQGNVKIVLNTEKC